MMGYQHQGMMNYGPHGHGGMGVPPGVMGGMGPPQGGPPGHGPSGQGSNMEKKIENYSFTLNNVLGKGSSGTVYKGKNDLTNTKVAIKCVDQRTLITEYAKELIRS
jgi:serine/threonine protein kinase